MEYDVSMSPLAAQEHLVIQEDVTVSDPDASKKKTMSDSSGVLTLSENERRRLRSYISRRIRNSSDVDDVLQETQMRLIAVDSMTEVANTLAYAFRVADSVMLQDIRKSRRQGDFPEQDPVLESPGPEQTVDFKQRMTLFKKALSDMPALRQKVFVRRHLKDMSRAEIAEDLGISLESVKKHLVRARQHLAGVAADIGMSRYQDMEGGAE